MEGSKEKLITFGYLTFDYLWITLVNFGGSDGLSRVQVYTVEGSKEQLAELNQPRKHHACGYFFNGNNLVITH